MNPKQAMVALTEILKQNYGYQANLFQDSLEAQHGHRLEEMPKPHVPNHQTTDAGLPGRSKALRIPRLSDDT